MAFDAGGMAATIDSGHRMPSQCFMIEQWAGGKFVRVYPMTKGSFDCKP
jgi:hypothetical protein